MNHYCTYFDRGFLIQGLALWRSLQAHDAEAALWVLALDDETASLLRGFAEPRLRVLPLVELEAADLDLAATRLHRSPVEYYFTASPCWLRWLLTAHPEIDRLTYVDADLLFFSSPSPVHATMDAAGASVLLTPHRFPSWQRHYERYGRYNKGCLAFRNDAAAHACLADWRARCLEWCHDRPEPGRYADQGYLTEWPERFGAAVLVLDHPGVNLAPWNWLSCRVTWGADDRPRFDGRLLVAFHFSRFKPLRGDWWWQSGQLDCGVMPWRLRQCIYGHYWRMLQSARSEIAASHPGFATGQKSIRPIHVPLSKRLLNLFFGGSWLRLGGVFISGRLGLGRWSGRCKAWLRRRSRSRGYETVSSINRPTVEVNVNPNFPHRKADQADL